MDKLEEQIVSLKRTTGFDETVVGCYLSNYGDRNICSALQNCGCSELMKCKTLRNIQMLRRKQNHAKLDQ